MLRRSVLLGVALLAGPAAAQPQTASSYPPPQVNAFVTLNSFNPVSNTYNAMVHVTARPCPDASYDLILNEVDVTNRDEAMAKAKSELDKITSDVNKAAERCPTLPHN